jgi:Na+/serine symporter
LPLNNVLSVSFKILTSILVVLIGFENHSKKTFLKNILILYLITLTFGGASFMFLFFVDPNKIILKANHFVGMYPVKMAMLGRIFCVDFNNYNI